MPFSPQAELYVDTCTAWTRGRARSTDSIGTPGAEVFTLAGTGIAYYHESTVNLPDVTEAGQMVTPDALTAEKGHFYLDQAEIEIGGILKNTTPGGGNEGKFFSILSDPTKSHPGALWGNKKMFRLRELSANDLPSGVS